MINSVLLASYSFLGGGAFGDLLTQWEQMGFFAYALPFILIFAVVFGVLGKIRIFEDNKAVNAIIALAVGFMSLQWDLVPRFFTEVFPRVGVGISILLIVIIFLGIFLPRENWAVYFSLIIAAVIVVTILLGSFESLGWQSSFFYNWNLGYVLAGVFAIAAVIAIIASSKERKERGFEAISPSFFRDMHNK